MIIMNKNKFPILMFFATILIFTSCKSTKKFSMFQELNKKKYLQTPVNIRPPAYKIKVFDNLYISILTLDDEVNKMLNPGISTGSGTNTTQMFGEGVGQYINGYQVGLDSTINIPIVGDVKVAGLTFPDAKNLLTEKAKEYLKVPTVEVKLLNYRLNILGEVNAPGYAYNYESSLNIIDALGMAGGITKFANLKEVIVSRQLNNLMHTYKIDLTDNNLYKSEVFYLQPNDVIYVPPSKLVMRSENVGNYSIFLSTLTSLLVIVSFFGINF